MPSNQAIPLTLGVEEEFQLLCPETLALVPAYDRLVACNLQDDFNIKSELHRSCCEVATHPCRTVAELDEALRSNRCSLIEIAERAGICVALSGTQVNQKCSRDRFRQHQWNDHYGCPLLVAPFVVREFGSAYHLEERIVNDLYKPYHSDHG